MCRCWCPGRYYLTLFTFNEQLMFVGRWGKLFYRSWEHFIWSICYNEQVWLIIHKYSKLIQKPLFVCWNFRLDLKMYEIRASKAGLTFWSGLGVRPQCDLLILSCTHHWVLSPVRRRSGHHRCYCRATLHNTASNRRNLLCYNVSVCGCINIIDIEVDWKMEKWVGKLGIFRR